MQLSNDVKWNKIRLIMNELGAYCNEQWREYLLDYDFEIAAKFAHRDTWILANKLYDIAVDGLDEDYYQVTQYQFPLTSTQIIEEIHNIKSNVWVSVRDYCWMKYDYLNS